MGPVPPFRRMLLALSGRAQDEGLFAYSEMLARAMGGLQTLPFHASDESVLLDSILDFAVSSRADLILLGHSGTRGRRFLARRLAMKAPCSVWMVPDGSPARISSVLAPIDFSRRSADTLSVATAIASGAGLDECTALHVYFNDAAATFDEFDEILLEENDRAFALFTAPIDLHDVWAKPLFLESSHVARAILTAAAEHRHDLIVMGTRGRSPAAAVLLGSETEQTMIETGIPLLTVKHFGARIRLMQALKDERVRKRTNERFT
jgi:nucleotide-binding universal stress UspA family protein